MNSLLEGRGRAVNPHGPEDRWRDGESMRQRGYGQTGR
jgi:hypothetical protein